MTFAFVLLCVLVGTIVLALAVERHDEGWAVATAVIVALLVTVELFTQTKPLSYMWHNVWSLGLWVVGYAAIGVVYIWVRWFFFVKNAVAYLRDRGPSEFAYKYGAAPPLQVRRFKSRIVGWGVYWPFSGLALLIDEPIKNFFNWVYNTISNSLQKMSDNQFGKFDKQ